MAMSTRIIVLALLFAFVFPIAVQADSPNYHFETVEVNDIIAYVFGSTNLTRNLNLEQLETINVQATLRGAANISGGFIDFVRCRATLEGYEFGTVVDETPVFTVEQGNVYQKTMTIQIPEDIETSEPYTLRVECADPRDRSDLSFTVFLNEIRHFIRIVDVLLNPSSTIQAGKPLFVTVRAENLGQKQEDDLKVVASIKDLGISATNFIPELVTRIQEREEQFISEDDSSGQLDLLLRIPEDAATGDYMMDVDLFYNRGHSKVSTKVPVHVIGIAKAPEEQVDTVVNIDSTVKQVAQGEEAVYRLMIANVGTKKGVYSVQLDGTSPWSISSADPGLLTLLPDGTGEISVRIRPNINTEPRDYVSVARVMLGSNVVQEINLNTRVVAKDKAIPVTPVNFKTILIGVFGILVIVLVVLGLVIAFKKSGKAEEESPSVAEGQTYYYHPKR